MRKKRLTRKGLAGLPEDYRELILLGRKEQRRRKRKKFWEEHFLSFFSAD